MKSLYSLVSVLFVVTPDLVVAKEKVVVCYYATPAVFRPRPGKFEISNIPTDLCTHLVYSYVGIDYFGSVVSLAQDVDYDEYSGKGYLRKFNALKGNNPHLKTLLGVGGFIEGSSRYSSMAGNPTFRQNFITSALNMVTKYGFDGLELDWEYPNLRDTIYREGDVDNFLQLLKALRVEFDKRGLLLAAGVVAVEQLAKLSYNVSAISSQLDLVNVMAYDLNWPWDSDVRITRHNAPLHKDTPQNLYTVDLALQYWLSHGCPPEKLVLGLPFYGRTFRLKNETQAGVGATSVGEGLKGPYTLTEGFIGYNELCQKFIQEPAWSFRRDALAMVPFAVQGRNWVSYDNAKSLVAKVTYGLQYGIAGVMVSSIDMDDFHGICRQGTFPLLKSVNAALNQGCSF